MLAKESFSPQINKNTLTGLNKIKGINIEGIYLLEIVSEKGLDKIKVIIER